MRRISLAALTIATVVTAHISGCAAPAPELTFTSAYLGFSMRYPGGWVYEEGGGQVLFGTSEEVVSGGDLEIGAAMLVVSSPAGDPPQVEQMIEFLLPQLPIKDLETGDPKPHTVGGRQGIMVTLEGIHVVTEVPLKGFVAGVDQEGWGQIFVAATTLNEWSDYGHVLERMLDSVSFDITKPAATAAPPAPQASPHADRKPVIIDTDMAVDDWLAILYLLQRPDVQVVAVTVTGTGEAHCDPGTQNTLNLLNLAGDAEVPVSCGREAPLAGDHVFPTSWRDMVDGMAGLPLPSNPNPPASQPAVELLTSVIQSLPEKVVLVTLGPLTNVAEALLNEPSLVDNLEMIYIMGGAVGVPGNLQAPGVEIDNRVAEWNIYVDPRAAAVVFESGAPITLVALDATNDARVTMEFYERLEADRTTPEAEFVYQVLSQMQGFIDSGDYFFWDPLAAAVATDESLVTMKPETLVVLEAEGPESGRTLVHEGGNSIRVCIDADGARFESVFLDTLNGRGP